MVDPEMKSTRSCNRVAETPTSLAASTSLLIASSARPIGDRRSAYEAQSASAANTRAYQYIVYFRFPCMGSDIPDEPPVNESQYVQTSRVASPTPMVAIEKYGPRNRSVGWPQISAKRPATTPPTIQAGTNGKPSDSSTRAVTKPPMPNMAACPKLTCPRYPPSQFQADAAAIPMKVSVI